MDVAPCSHHPRRRPRDRRTRRPFASCRAAWLAIALLGIGVVASATPGSAAASPAMAVAAADAPPAVGSVPIDINRASADELAEALPGIGPVKARAIVAWRRTNGPFIAIEQLLEVTGIGPRTLERIGPLVTLGDGAPPPDPVASPGAGPTDPLRANTVRTVRLLVEEARRRAAALPAEP